MSIERLKYYAEHEIIREVYQYAMIGNAGIRAAAVYTQSKWAMEPEILYKHLIHHAAECGLRQPLYEILEHSNNRAVLLQHALQHACMSGNLESVKELIEKLHARPKGNENMAFKTAMEYGHLPIVQYLVNICRVNPHYVNSDAINAAVEGGYMDVIKFILEDCRCDPNLIGEDALVEAASAGYLPVLEYLQTKGLCKVSSPTSRSVIT